MTTYQLDLTLEAPLAVSAGRDTSHRYELPDAIPPTTLRGALAALMQRRGLDAAQMEAIFGPGGCRTSALLPSTGAGPVRVAPLTLRTCKRRRGFQGEPGAHGVEDLLFASLEMARGHGASALMQARQCARESCGHALVRLGGFICAAGEGWQTAPPPDRRMQAHVGIDRRRDGAASGVLYAREVMSEQTAAPDWPGRLRPTRLQAQVTAPEEAMALLAEALGEEGAELRIGTARSRGLGRCRVDRFAAVSDVAPVADRIARFNDAWEKWGGAAPAGALVALTLETPALFVDAFLRPDLSPGPEALLQAATSDEEAHARRLARLARVHQVGRPYQMQAWNGLAGFPHASDQGLAMGSVLVFEARDVDDALLDALAHVEKAGVGLRRELGFGRVRVCDPIHAAAHEHSAA